MTEIQLKRVAHFNAWSRVLAARQPKAKNPYHDCGGRGGLNSYAPVRSPLQAELDAWEEASDEDFEAFERTLE